MRFEHTGEAERLELRTRRILKIIAQIATAPRRWTRADLAAHYAISERMITKDLSIIRSVVAPLAHEPGGGYYFAADPPADLLQIAL